AGGRRAATAKRDRAEPMIGLEFDGWLRSYATSDSPYPHPLSPRSGRRGAKNCSFIAPRFVPEGGGENRLLPLPASGRGSGGRVRSSRVAPAVAHANKSRCARAIPSGRTGNSAAKLN